MAAVDVLCLLLLCFSVDTGTSFMHAASGLLPVQHQPCRLFQMELLQRSRGQCSMQMGVSSADRRQLLSLIAAMAFTTPASLLTPISLAAYPLSGSASLKSEEQTLIKLFEAATPSVVNINTFVERRDGYSMNVMEVPSGTGSGIVWDETGIIVTNFHVIKDAEAARVITADQQVYAAKLQGYSPDKDIAVLKITPDKPIPFPVQLGSSKNLQVGQLAVAIGNPFGLDHSLTVGVVSGLGREVMSPTGRPITNVIQTDAAINPGNSGGPLLDSSGKLIGMNTAIYSPSGASAGIGFAIPVDTLSQQVDTILKYGRVVRPVIGISYLESNQARALGISDGVLVLDVPQGSLAARAGLRGTIRSGPMDPITWGDVIVAIDDEEVRTEGQLYKVLDTHVPGDAIKVTVDRTEPGSTQPRRLDLSITLAGAVPPGRPGQLQEE